MLKEMWGLGMKNYFYALSLMSIDNVSVRMSYPWTIIECTDRMCV